MASITFEGVYKRYADGYEAVKDMNLHIADGEFMILVGPSGCGKSTALRMIAGLEDISAGTLRIGSDDVRRVDPKDRDVAMVFQNYALYPHMTVRQNMGYALKLTKLPKAEVQRKVTEAARILDLESHLDRKPSQLSGGQRQRVAMGRAIVRDPAAFLLDEPLSNLDAKLRVQMRTEIARLQEQLGTTTVYVTHDQTEAMTLGDRVAVMRSGVLQQLDTPKALYERPANLFVAGFIGSPAMNFVSARIEDDQLVLPFGSAPLPATLRATLSPSARRGRVIAGIRAEHFSDAGATAAEPSRLLRFRVRPSLVEFMGSEQFAYFGVDDRADVPEVDELAEDAGIEQLSSGDGTRLIAARVDGRSRAAAGQELHLDLDLDLVQLFDPHTGASLLSPGPADAAPAPVAAGGSR